MPSEAYPLIKEVGVAFTVCVKKVWIKADISTSAFTQHFILPFPVPFRLYDVTEAIPDTIN